MDIRVQLNPGEQAVSIQNRGAAKQDQKKTTAAKTDRMTISRQAVEYLEENDRRMQEEAQKEAEQENDGDPTSDGGASDILDMLSKSMKEMEKCNKIAASIMKGKRVPLEDLQYLMEHDTKGYQLAMAMRMPSKDDKEEESVLDDEDRNGSASESSSGTEAASGETAGESEGAALGGEAPTDAEGGVSGGEE